MERGISLIRINQTRTGSWYKLDLEGIVGPTVVQIVAQTSDDQRKALNLAEDLPPLRGRQDGKHHLRNVERVPPVVIGDVAIVLLDRTQPPAENFVVDVKPLDQIQIQEHPQASLQRIIVLQEKVIEFEIMQLVERCGWNFELLEN